MLNELRDSEIDLAGKLQVLKVSFLEPIAAYYNRRVSSVEGLDFDFPASFTDEIRILGDMIGFAKRAGARLSEAQGDVNRHTSQRHVPLPPIIRDIVRKVDVTFNQFIARESAIRWAVSQWCKVDPDFKKFVHNQRKAAPRGCSLELLLMAPLQRVFSYKALLDRFVENTPETHVDHAGLVACQLELNKAVQHIEVRRKRMGLMEKLEAKFAGMVENFCAEDRELLWEGGVWLYTGYSQGWQARYLFVLNDCCLLCSANLESKCMEKDESVFGIPQLTNVQSRNILHLDRKCWLAGAKCKKIESRPHGLELVGPADSEGQITFEATFAALTEDDCREIFGVLLRRISYMSVLAMAAAKPDQYGRNRSDSDRTSALPPHLRQLYKQHEKKLERMAQLGKLDPGISPANPTPPTMEKDDIDVRVKMQRSLAWHRHSFRFTPKMIFKLNMTKTELQAVVRLDRLSKLEAEVGWDGSTYLYLHFLSYLRVEPWCLYLPDNADLSQHECTSPMGCNTKLELLIYIIVSRAQALGKKIEVGWRGMEAP